ncbi:MAG: M48 family metallopeptidase [Clostridia bacterium]|nr:M48 family metallopeptidase [Clostridia bacterium]
MKQTEREVSVPYGKLSFLLERKPIKSLRLRVLRDGRICVSAPAFVSVREIDAFVSANASKIQKAVEQRKTQLQKAQKTYQTGDKIRLLGHEIRIEVRQSQKQAVSIEGGTLSLFVKDVSDTKKTEALAKAFLRKEAERVFLSVLYAMHPAFAKLGVQMPQLRVRDMKSLYGSCAYKKGIITLNLHLLEAPVCCIEYVMAHELCHFLVPDHSKRFYSLLESIMPDYKQRKKELKERL